MPAKWATASITLVSASRVIGADAIIDLQPDGLADDWEIDSDSAPALPSPFDVWSSQVEAEAEVWSEVGVSGGSVFASVTHESSFFLEPTRLVFSAANILDFDDELMTATKPGPTSSGIVPGESEPRSSRAFSVAIFEFQADGDFSFEGVSRESWSLFNLDLDPESPVARGKVSKDGAPLLLSGVLGPGLYRFEQAHSNNGNKSKGDGQGDGSTLFTVESLNAAVPEPSALVAWSGLALVAGVCQFVRQRKLSSSPA